MDTARSISRSIRYKEADAQKLARKEGRVANADARARRRRRKPGLRFVAEKHIDAADSAAATAAAVAGLKVARGAGGATHLLAA